MPDSRIHRIILLVVVLFVMSALTHAEVPQLINYQGRLTDSENVPLDTITAMTFTIYADEAGTIVLWTETHSSIIVSDGLFNVLLGTVAPIGSGVFDGSVRWLGVQLDDGPVMDPLVPIISVAYAFRAVRADTSGFAADIANNCVTNSKLAGNAVTSNKIADGAIQMADIGQNGAATNQVIKWNGSAWSTADDETGSSAGWVDDGTNVRLTSITDKVGIGTTTPQEKLHVEGDIRLGSSNSIAFGSDSNRLYSSSTDMILTADDDIHLQPDDDIYIRRDGGSAWVHFDNSAKKLGIGTVDPDYRLTVEGEISISSGGASKYHINYYDGGLNFAETGVQDRRIHIGDGGNVGIGTANPGAKLGVNGSLKVKGAYIGDISSSTGTDGAPFPRPAYNSGWLEIAQGATLILTHDIGGDIDDYLVDFQVWNPMEGLHSIDYCFLYAHNRGAYYYDLTSSQINVKRWIDDVYVEKIRVRIWVLK